MTQVGATLVNELRNFLEEIDYEESEKQALQVVSKAESATKTALMMQGRYYEALKSLQKLSPTMALGTLEAMRDLATRCTEAIKGAATAWESAEKAAGITNRVRGQYERMREQYHFDGGSFSLNDTQAKTEGRLSIAEQSKLLREFAGAVVGAMGGAQAPIGTIPAAADDVPKHKDEAGGDDKPVTIVYRIPGKGSWKKKTFPSEKASQKWIEALTAKEGDDVEIRWEVAP